MELLKLYHLEEARVADMLGWPLQRFRDYYRWRGLTAWPHRAYNIIRDTLEDALPADQTQSVLREDVVATLLLLRKSVGVMEARHKSVMHREMEAMLPAPRHHHSRADDLEFHQFVHSRACLDAPEIAIWMVLSDASPCDFISGYMRL